MNDLSKKQKERIKEIVKNSLIIPKDSELDKDGMFLQNPKIVGLRIKNMC